MRKSFFLAVVIFAGSLLANAGVVRYSSSHIVKPSAKAAVKGVKFAGKQSWRGLKFAAKVIY
jgi:hypothetical protein